MSTATESRSPAAPSYTPHRERAALLADALGCIISGRSLPEILRAPSLDPGRPTSVEDAIRRILAGGSTAAR